MQLDYISLFSGIEAASVAWEPLGWNPVAFAEIEPFPCAVLQERYPDVPIEVSQMVYGMKLPHHDRASLQVCVTLARIRLALKEKRSNG